MASKDLYILGINAYDHDVSVCLLKNGAIAAAVGKERITRIKKDTGFYQEPLEYCLEVGGIYLNQVDLVVRNSYVRPVEALDERLAHHDEPDYLSEIDRKYAMKSPLYLSSSDWVQPVSHHLAHAYSAFAVSPFQEGDIKNTDLVKR